LLKKFIHILQITLWLLAVVEVVVVLRAVAVLVVY
jgi:hypothetical protein